MEESVDFDIHEALKEYTIDPAKVPTPAASSEVLDAAHDPELLTPALINSVLHPVIDEVAESPDAVFRSSVFDTLQCLLKLSQNIPLTALTKLLDLLTDAISTEAEHANEDIEAENDEAMPRHKQLLSMYAFLLHWAVSSIETREASEKANPRRSNDSSSAAAKRGKGAKAKKNEEWDPSDKLERSLDVMKKVLSLRLIRIFDATSERDTFVTLFTKAVFHLLEDEAKVKKRGMKDRCYRVLCVAVKFHNQTFSAQTAIIQNLTYFEHLSEPMAEFLNILSKEFAYDQLAEEVLKELANKEFHSTDSKGANDKGPKSVSVFLTKISELQPKIVYRHMTVLATLLESEAYAVRMALIDICGNLIIMLSQEYGEDPPEDVQKRIQSFYEVLEERFRDLNPYCRCRVMQVYSKLCERELLGYKQQQKAADLTTESLKDKSSHVRRNAIKLLTKLVLGNLFSRDDAENGGLLATEQWVKLLEQTEREIEILDPPQELPEDEETVDASLLQDATQVAPEEAPRELTEEERNALQQKQQEEFERMAQLNDRHKKRKWLLGALKFIGTINRSAETVTMLLSSKNKNEVIDAMDFFTTIDAYKLTTARAGIKKMLRLIWTKGNSDDGKSIQTHLIECYRKIFFVAPDGYSSNETAIFIANNMISLTFGTTPAELTSLEQLLSTMMKQGLVSELVIQKLWIIYGYQKKEKSMRQKRGAIIVLGMLALAKPEIITAEIDVCLRVGLGEIGRRDLLLARYTCIALKRISPPPGKKTPDNGEHKAIRFPEDHPVLARLASIIQIVSDSQEWFGLAEQALSAIYVLAKHPDVLCSDILKRKTKYVFGLPAVTRPGSSGSAAGGAKPAASSQDAVMQDVHAEDQPMEDVQMEDAPMERVQTSKTQDPAIALAQLLFIVGHVAIKQIVHLGLCEQEHNRREAERKKKQPTPRASLASEGASSTRGGRGRGRTKTPKTATPGLTVDDELDAMAGKDEDEFKDRLETVREFELLYAHNALLAQYGPLVRKICANKRAYNHPTLQAQAALCLAKLMCVSKRYCEENLITFLKLVQGSEDPIVRSNLVVGLGDICICFEETVEKYMDLLYERLTDRDSSVKRACLMTLSFLMLAARIKVGGKELGNIAKCLEDSDKMFVDMARTFFSELATKDKAVYSNFQNIFSLLSADSSLDEEAFRRIIKYIAGFIEKDKEAKSTVKHLKEKMEKASDERQWRDIAYAISLFNQKSKDEDAAKMIAAGFRGRAAGNEEVDATQAAGAVEEDGDVVMGD